MSDQQQNDSNGTNLDDEHSGGGSSACHFNMVAARLAKVFTEGNESGWHPAAVLDYIRHIGLVIIAVTVEEAVFYMFRELFGWSNFVFVFFHSVARCAVAVAFVHHTFVYGREVVQLQPLRSLFESIGDELSQIGRLHKDEC